MQDAQEFVWAFTQVPLQPGQDQDGDALLTFVELGGVAKVPLHTYGASPFARDIFVEVDYMSDGGAQEVKMSDEAQ